eukprot:5493532-Prymnesium_polylepis.1
MEAREAEAARVAAEEAAAAAEVAAAAMAAAEEVTEAPEAAEASTPESDLLRGSSWTSAPFFFSQTSMEEREAEAAR